LEFDFEMAAAAVLEKVLAVDDGDTCTATIRINVNAAQLSFILQMIYVL